MLVDSKESVEYLNKRFHNCDDGVIRHLEVVYRSGANRPSSVKIVLSVRDSEFRDNDGFVNLKLILNNVPEFSFNEGDISYQVLSEGLKIIFINGLIFITFNPHNNPESISSIRDSSFYCACKRLEWEILPYKDYVSPPEC